MNQGTEGLFELFQAGDDDALLAILDADRSRFYDYVFRMTGNEFAARETMNALAAFGITEGRRYATLDGLRAALFSEARTENRREWNAPTHKLTEIPDEVSSQLKTLGLDDLDRAFRSLPGPEREVLILIGQNGFSAMTAAAILGVSENQVIEWQERGESMLKVVVGEEHDFVSGLQRLPFTVAEEQSDHSTVALSQVIDAVRKVRPGLRAHLPLARLFFFVVLVSAIGGGFYLFFK